MNNVVGWRYREGIMIADNHPHEEANMAPLKDGSIWKYSENGKKPLMARWTSDFDCGHETPWYYVIKDTPFDLMAMKSSNRYSVTRGNRNFEVKVVDPKDYFEQLYKVTIAAFSAYPEEYRPSLSYENFCIGITSEENTTMFAAFHKETGEIQGYLTVVEFDDYERGSTMKANPEYERLYINDALIAAMLDYYNPRLEQGKYIDFGETSISHKTGIYGKLVHQYGFKYAYCKLNVAYNPMLSIAVKVLYPFRSILQKMESNRLVHKINSVLIMENIARECK